MSKMFKNRYGKKAARDLRLLLLLIHAQRSVKRRLLTHIRSANFTPAQFDVLETLYHKGPLTVNDVIEKTLSSSGNICVIINNLMALGLLEKEVDEADHRVRQLRLTETGRQRMAEYFPGHLKEVKAVFSGLKPSEKAVLSDLLRKLRKSL